MDGLIESAVEHQMSAVALTDHGVNFGNLEFYQKARKAGVKPIVGCEIYVADGDRFDKSSLKASGGQKRRNYFHLILLAKSFEGYKTLNKLTSRAHTEGFYYKPRVDRQLLADHHEGLVCLSACAGGVVSAHLVNNDFDRAREAAIWYRELFGEDFYLEIQNHGIPVDKPVLEGMPLLAKELGIPLIATNDCHYIRKDHAIAHNVLLHIRDASKNGVALDVEDELRYGTDNYYFKSAEEMATLFKEFPDAIERTLEVAEKCDLKIPEELHMPDFPIPVTSQAKDLDEYLQELTWQGIGERYTALSEEIRERTEFELEVITRMGYAGYFLIVYDFIKAARDMGVRVGPGRGSAAGSLVAYALQITDIDPLKYDLLFERFLNPDRVSMPDIDVDFADDKREKVIEYVKEKYGEEAVSQIITFSTLSSRAVLKDVGRVLGIPHTTINEITKDIQVKFGRVQKLKDAVENPELRWVKESNDPKIKKLIDYSLVLEGFSRAASTHAAGVVIAPGPLEEYIPLYKTPTTGLASQYTMKYLEDAGLLKMDFLGLRTLTIIEDALALIKMRHGVDLDIDTIPLDNKATYAMIGKGLTTAVFQFESPPMQKYLKQLKPERLDDLIAMNALYRPGPMDNIPDFIERRLGLKEIEYLHEKLESILGTTYGICVTGDTRVIDALTGKTYRVDELKDVQNLWLQGVDEKLEKSYGPVTHFFNNGIKPVVKVQLRNGSSARMTRDHQVLTEQGWKEIGTLNVGDYIAVPRELDVLSPNEYDQNRLRALAYLIADGSLTSGSSVDFVSKDERLTREYKRAVSEGFQDIEFVDLTQVRDVTRTQVRGKNKSYYHQPNSLLVWLRQLGLKYQRGGCDSSTKFIPDFVFSLSQESIALFIASLWDCDGYVGERLCHYRTISPQLANDLQTLLLRLGIQSDIYSSEYFSERRNCNVTAYQVTVYNLTLFNDLIGNYLIAKSTGVCRTTTRSNTETVSRSIFKAELETAWNGSYRQLMGEHGIDRQHFLPPNAHRERIPTDIVAPLLEGLNLPVTEKNTHVRWERIESIEDAGEDQVYDITVAGIHNFVGNNTILHNCVYQEQIMQIAQKLGGFTLAQADSLRRAMGKKQIQYMEEMKGDYFAGCAEQGIDKKTADEIWEMMVKFADYGFNKSHSAAYAWIAYQTAFLKANYTPEFLAANMTNEASDQSKIVKLIDESKSFNVKVLPPDINQSMVNFSVDKKGQIIFGMAAIRNVGHSAVQAILDERKESGTFNSIFDFTKRLSGNSLINKRLLEHLVLSGAFDSVHFNRRQCFEAIDSAIGYGGAWAEQKASGMDSLFAIAGEDGSDASIPEPTLPNVDEWNRIERLKREKEVLDFYVSGHPLEDFELEAESFSEIMFGELPEELDTTRPTRVCGIVSYVRTKLDRRENQFAIVGIEDFTGKAECVFWSDAWRRNASMVTEGSIIFVTGRAEIEGADKLRIIADEVTPVKDALLKFTKGVAINVILDEVNRETAEQTAQLIAQHQGDVQCMFRLYDSQGALVGRWSARKATVSPSHELLNQLYGIFGRPNVRIAG